MGHHQSSTPVSQKGAMKPDKESLKKITSLPNWKFYGNPYYHHHHRDEEEQARDLWSPHDHRAATMDPSTADEASRYQRRIKSLEEQQARSLSLVSSLRSELDLARTRIAELRSVVRALQGELEGEIGARKRLESANKSLSKELEKERISKEVVEGVCDELAREIGKDRAEVEEMRRECERVRVEVAEDAADRGGVEGGAGADEAGGGAAHSGAEDLGHRPDRVPEERASRRGEKGRAAGVSGRGSFCYRWRRRIGWLEQATFDRESPHTEGDERVRGIPKSGPAGRPQGEKGRLHQSRVPEGSFEAVHSEASSSCGFERQWTGESGHGMTQNSICWILLYNTPLLFFHFHDFLSADLLPCTCVCTSVHIGVPE